MQNIHVKEIAEIIAGYTFRGALKHDLNGKCEVVSAKNINEDGSIDYNGLTRILQLPPRTNAFVKENDVILSSRGVFRAGVYRKKSQSIIASSSTFILRVDNTKLLPEYLAIYLNSEVGQASIRRVLTGSSIKTILRKSLENLQIPIPSIDIQKKIIDIRENWQVQEGLLNRKINLNKGIAAGAIKQLLTK